MNLKKMTALKAVPTNRNSNGKRKGVLVIVCSKKNGKRLEILEPLVNELKLETEVQFGIIDKGLVIGEKLPGITQKCSLKNSKNKKIVYSSALVEEIIEKLGLDFSNKVSQTLTGVELQEYEGKMIARVYEDVQEAKAND